ncbi:rod-binding protein [Acidimangrovimonas sediminis]|uniref:rod-binding protein n=1 Tax=Acidimangrovimonas sediminis TaxID=2056283 RepID=UPI000C806F7F|nr:rod-binding protein [Acidimangrovimonas sediminis]
MAGMSPGPVGPRAAAAQVGGAADAKADAKAVSAARDFESVFLTQMVEQMMKTVKLGNMDGGHAQEIWRSFLSKAIADQIADTGTTGIAQSVNGAMQAYDAARKGATAEGGA